MVVTWFVQALCWLFSHALGLMPSWSAPAFIGDMDSAITSISGYIASLSSWIPWSAIGIAVPILLASAFAALAVKGVRVVLSYVTGGGGSAA